MARLQDFQSVTPSSSDNLLIVQATGQGLVNYGSTIGNKAPKSDLASISITGTTNNTGSTIKAGTFFYLNGTLVRAKTDISNGATLTSGTNYEVVTAGGLNINPLGTMIKTIPSTRQYVVSSGTLNANSYGYVAVSVAIPSGYKTTGLVSFYLGHPAAAGGLQLCGGISQNQTGTITLYISYFTPVAIASSNTDFFVDVGIIDSNVNIN